MFNDKEKELLKRLVKKEIEDFAGDEKTIRPALDLIEAEEKYEIFLENLLKKL